ncbi:MAG: glycosyltransferase family 4 protein [Candidatus Acidiferrales bacterium]
MRLAREALIKVLFLHVGENWIRGSENVLLTIFRGLDKQQIQPFLICDQPAMAEAARVEGIETTLFRFPNIMMDSDTFQFDFAQWVRMARQMRSLVSRKEIQLLYSNSARPCQVAHYVANWQGIPLICHLHAAYARRYILLYRVHLASRIILPSHAVETLLKAGHSHLPISEVIYFGVDTERFRPAEAAEARWRQEIQIPADAIVFGQVSYLVADKGVDTLLRAFQVVCRRLPNARLVVVGDGPLRSEFDRLAAELSISSRVHFAGYRPDTENYYRYVFDVNILASRKEALGIAALEAAACGLPCICANTGGLPEAIEHGKTGLLFETDNVSQLAERMAELGDSPALRRSMGEAGCQRIRDRFSRPAFVRSIERTILNTTLRRSNMVGI